MTDKVKELIIKYNNLQNEFRDMDNLSEAEQHHINGCIAMSIRILYDLKELLREEDNNEGYTE